MRLIMNENWELKLLLKCFCLTLLTGWGCSCLPQKRYLFRRRNSRTVQNLDYVLNFSDKPTFISFTKLSSSSSCILDDFKVWLLYLQFSLNFGKILILRKLSKWNITFPAHMKTNWLNWFSYCQETADLVTFTEEIHNGKPHFLCSVFCEMKSTMILS